MTARSGISEVGIFVVYLKAFRATGSSSATGQKRQKIDNNEQFSLSLSHRVPPCPLKDRLGTPSKVLGSASLSPSSCLLPSSASASLPCSAILPKLLQLPGHHHSRHHWCMPFSFAVHRDLCFTCVYVHRFTAQS